MAGKPKSRIFMNAKRKNGKREHLYGKKGGHASHEEMSLLLVKALPRAKRSVRIFKNEREGGGGGGRGGVVILYFEREGRRGVC